MKSGGWLSHEMQSRKNSIRRLDPPPRQVISANYFAAINPSGAVCPSRPNCTDIPMVRLTGPVSQPSLRVTSR
jgi:hypothetical protein